jgi:hypothetical protein
MVLACLDDPERLNRNRGEGGQSLRRAHSATEPTRDQQLQPQCDRGFSGAALLDYKPKPAVLLAAGSC